MKVVRNVSFELGGVKRRCEVTFRAALDIEEATGQGLFQLAYDVANRRARVSHVAEVFRIVLDAGGARLPTDDIVEMIGSDGLATAYAHAANILVVMVTPPKGAEGKKSTPQKAA